MTSKKSYKERWLEWLAPGTTNFIGTGLTLEEFLQLGGAERFHRSWSEQPKPERERRLQFVFDLVAERQRIAERGILGIAWVDQAIEAVIKGDRLELEHVQHMIARIAKDEVGLKAERFQELILQCLLSWPEQNKAEA